MSELDVIYEKAKEVLRREINNLFIESSKGPLTGPRASALVSYLKLLKDLEEETKDLEKDLQRLTPEQLIELAKKYGKEQADKP